jgi:hypothetical protein
MAFSEVVILTLSLSKGKDPCISSLFFFQLGPISRF